MPLLKKLISRFKGTIKKSATVDSESIKYLKKLVNRFEKALDNAQGGVKISQIGNADDEREETADSSQQTADSKVDDERKSQTKTEQKVEITVQDAQNLKSIAPSDKKKSVNDLTSEEIRKAENFAKLYYKELGTKSPFFRAWYGDWREFEKNTYTETVDEVGDNRKQVVNIDTGWSINASGKVHKETNHHSGSSEKNALKYLPYIDDITKKAILLDSVVSNSDNDNSLMFHSLYAYTEIMGYPALLKLKVEELLYHTFNESGIIRRDYILQNIEEEPISKRNRFSRPNHLKTNSSVISISDLFKIVKQYDKDFKPKSVNSLLLDENGMPKVLYHGTNAEFFEFDKAKIQVDNLGKGFYLADQKKIAESYASRRTEERGGSPKVMEVYLKADKPLHAEKLTREDVKSFYAYQNQKDGDSKEDAVKNAEDDLNYAETIGKKRGWFDGDYSNLVGTNDEYFKEWAISEGYDCFVIPGKDKRTGLEGVAYVVFEPNQIKSATDNIGTFDSSNPDIRYSKQRSYNPFEDVDDEGNKWVEGEDENGVKILFSVPDFDNPAYEYNHAPDEESEIIETYKAVASSSTESDLRKRLADATKMKVYARKEAKSAFDEIITERGYFEGLNVNFKGKSRTEIEKMLWNAFNSADEGARMGPALDIAEAIITNAVVTENYEMTPTLELAYAITGYLKTHLHNINLDHIKGEIKAKYDKNTSVYAMWARKEGTGGVTADQIKDELEEIIPGK